MTAADSKRSPYLMLVVVFTLATAAAFAGMLALWLAIVQALPNLVSHALAQGAPVIAFQMALKEDALEAAYAVTSTRFQNAQSFDRFVDLVREHPEFRSEWMSAHTSSDDSCAFAFDEVNVRLEIRLAREGTNWKIDDLAFSSD